MARMSRIDAEMLPPGAGDELRIAPRFTLMLRAGKLIGRGQFLCILRDVSERGVKARLFHPLPPGKRFELELGNGEHYPLDLVWQDGGQAGFRFANGPVDVALLLDEAGPFRKRQIRLQLHLPVRIVVGGHKRIAMLRDISQQGALIDTAAPLALGQQLRLEASGLPTLFAKVRWRQKAAHGLVFETIFRLDELARMAGEVQLAEPRPA